MVWESGQRVGPEAGRLLAYLQNLPLDGGWQDQARVLLRTREMDPRVDEEFVLYADETVVIKGNTQASAGCTSVRTSGRRVTLRTSTHPASHDDCQVFQFLARARCVTRALELIEADPRVQRLLKMAQQWIETDRNRRRTHR